ncbi:MAG: hypothetical protein E7610_03150 [Ruminococcaceae bacterium]|nr:hypothetical protein [Oscillospiraceae bacterium]
MTENNRTNNHSQCELSHHEGVLKSLKRNVILQASLAFATILLTVVLVFSLTAAWYINVVQTGDLAFETKQWNFDGHIELLSRQRIEASPGDEGTISLRITNGGDHIVAAGATVDKKAMEEEMQKRLYFYVDTAASRNGETVERVFLSATSSYAYTILPHSTLELTETVKNGPLIRWMWVYDVLGYYVWGQSADGTVVPQDYIRPIEYGYDPVTTTFDADGELATVDGSVSVASFLQNLTTSDGYEGVLDLTDPSVQAVDGYYPISVNADGCGVWLYLCDREEILGHMQYDTSLGSSTGVSCVATLTITGQNSREDSISVTTLQELKEALQDPTAGVIRLSDSLTLTESLSMTEGTAILDLNGHTLRMGEGVETLVSLSSGAKLSIENGTLEGSDAKAVAVDLTGAHLTMNDVTVTRVDTGVRINDHNAASGHSSTVYVNGSTITAGQYGVRIYGNQNNATTRTRVEIRDSDISGTGYAGILCNGTYGGTDTVVSNSTVSGLYTAIYHPQQDSTLTVEDRSVLTGYTGLVVKGGTVTVKDSTVRGIMENPAQPAYSVSGWTDTGDGIYLEANYATVETPVSVTVVNSTVTSDYAYAVRKYEAEASYAVLTVRSGTYTGFAKADTPDFSAAVSMAPYVADGSSVADQDGGRTCIVTQTVAP